jgi:two-component system phosphate regulon response regulator PhoB
LRVHNLVLKSEINTLLVGDEKVSLRPKETALLEYFLRNPNRIFSAQQVLDAVWTSDSSATPNTVRTWMGLLRHKLAPLGHKNLIRTVAGAGYVLDSN